MIDKELKLVQIAPPSPQEIECLRLDTADGRFQLADRLLHDIDTWCAEQFDDGPRNHLGASVIGGKCDRATWYSWRWFHHKKHSGQMQRLFQDGHWYEERFIQMLRGIGCNVTQVSEDGPQHRIWAVEGHFGGSLDGQATLPARYGPVANNVFLTEFKTSNHKNFVSLNHLQEDKEVHWGQMCVYGVKKKIRYGIYFVVNKNDADMKIFVVELDWELGQHLIDKGERIIFSTQPPPRVSNNPSNYLCKMCDHHSVCMMGARPDVNCRSCRHSEPVDEKQWHCRQWNAIIPSREAMLAGCQAYEAIAVTQ
jgi:hypothetical protein